MVLDEKTGTLYIAELGATVPPFPGRIWSVPFAP
jgi:hypothetical protein